MNTLNIHPQNRYLNNEIASICRARGYRAERYVTNTHTFDGYTRYVVLEDGGQPRPSQPRYASGVTHIEDARHSRCRKPSIVGEQRALRSLLNSIR